MPSATWVTAAGCKVLQTLGQCCGEVSRRELAARTAQSEEPEEALRQASVTLWSLTLSGYATQKFEPKEGAVLPIATLAIDSRLAKAAGNAGGSWAPQQEQDAKAAVQKARESQNSLQEAHALLNLAAVQVFSWASKDSKDAAMLRPVGDLLRQAVVLFEKEKDHGGEAMACNMLANFYILVGQARDAIRSAKQGLAAMRALGANQLHEVPILQTLMSASFLRQDVDEAFRACEEAARLCKESKAPSAASALADLCIAQAHLANDEQGQAQRLAEASLKSCAASKDQDAEIIALGGLQEIAFTIGKPISAQKAAQELLEKERRRGIKEAVARALLRVSISDVDGEMAQQAKQQYASLGDKVNESLASVSLASALLSQSKTSEATAAAKEAMTSFQAAALPAGQGFASCLLSVVQLRQEDSTAAERLAREAMAMFQDAQHRIGQGLAELLVRRAHQLRDKPRECKIVIDDFSVAHVEISGICTPKSLEQVLNALHQARCKDGVKAVVLVLQGAKGPTTPAGYGGAAPPSQALASGTFLLGLRTLGLPCVAACCGKVAGPAWGLVLAADYRIASATSSFILPIWGPPECFGDLVGHTVAMQLCYNQGPVNALTMLEYGVVHQCQRGEEDTKQAAAEVARRIASTPTLACHQTTTMLSSAIEKYASIVASGGVKA
mmetsp:Transcript_64531/g.151649  ORF Transcript_64531/g.151649 Transcript_64531/m.151649 type:complete len:672 (+) Transcript_64531:48-2063(+)